MTPVYLIVAGSLGLIACMGWALCRAAAIGDRNLEAGIEKCHTLHLVSDESGSAGAVTPRSRGPAYREAEHG